MSSMRSHMRWLRGPDFSAQDLEVSLKGTASMFRASGSA